MISNSTENKITKAITFYCVDNKTGKTFSRIAEKEFLEFAPMISNTEIAFSDKTIESFKKWMAEKGYLKTDCWCKHIEEFVAVKEFVKDANI